jgi:hypothetical protein
MLRKGVIAAYCSSYAAARQQIESWDGNIASCERGNNPNLPENRVKKRPCKYYNSSFQKIWWRERRHRCNTEEGCNFTGWSYTGTCNAINPEAQSKEVERPLQEYASKVLISLAPVVLPSDDPVEEEPVVEAPVVAQDVVLEDLNTDAAPGMSYSLLGDVPLGSEQDILDLEPITAITPPAVVTAPPVVRTKPVVVKPPKPTIASSLRQMIGDRASSSAAITVQESEEAAKEAVKIILREALNGRENRNLFGEFLTSIFVSPELLTPVRDVIYWSVADEVVMKQAAENMKEQRDFLLGFSAELKEGQMKATRLKKRTKGLVDESLMTNVIEWFEDPELPSTTVIPLLDYTLKQQDDTILPLAAITVDVIPWVKVRPCSLCELPERDTVRRRSVSSALNGCILNYPTCPV